MQDVIKSNCLSVRETLGWSRDRLAKMSDVPVSAVYLLERLGWNGTPEDRRILSALELALAQRLKAATLLDGLVAACQTEDDRQPNYDDAPQLDRVPQYAELSA